MTTTETLTRPGPVAEPPRPLLAGDWGDDPLAGIPRELIEHVGAVDHDTAGGCG